MPPQQQNPYEFILAPQTSRSSGPQFLQDPRKRLVAGIAFVVIVLLIVIIIASLLLGGGGGSTQNIRTVALQQAEISRIAALGSETARKPETRQLAATLQAVIGSDLQSTLVYLEENGDELNEKQLAASADPDRTALLEAAKQRNTFDEDFTAVIDALVTQYKADLQTSLNAANTPNQITLVESSAQNILTIFPNE